MIVCLAPSRVLCAPTMGGHAWVYANWSFGLRANGCEVVWLERFNPDTPPHEGLRLLRGLRSRLAEIGLDVPVTLFFWPGQRQQYACVEREIAQLTRPLEEVAGETDLLLNFYYALEPEVLRQFKRTALVDIDPGLLQSWISQQQLAVAPYDTYFTIGETVGTPDSQFPDCGIPWHYVPPAVHLPAWPISKSDPCAAYTTISTWWSDWEDFDSETFSNEKRSSFMDYLSLPCKTSVQLELALCMLQSDPEHELLGRKGWRLVDPWEDCNTPQKYRGYIQRSRGEFSCAKPSCMRLRNAWISDRTLCYLSSGKPAVVQHTGPSRFLPDAEGLFRFHSPEEAISAFEQIEADYNHQARKARELVEEFFNAEGAAKRVLDRAIQ